MREMFGALVAQLIIFLIALYEASLFPDSWIMIATIFCFGAIAIECIMIKRLATSVDESLDEPHNNESRLESILLEYVDNPNIAKGFAEQVTSLLADSDWVYPEDITCDGIYMTILKSITDPSKFVLVPGELSMGRWEFDIEDGFDYKLITVDCVERSGDGNEFD